MLAKANGRVADPVVSTSSSSSAPASASNPSGAAPPPAAFVYTDFQVIGEHGEVELTCDRNGYVYKHGRAAAIGQGLKTKK